MKQATEILGRILVICGVAFNVIPPLFAKGGFFASKGHIVDMSGDVVEVPDIYYDNSYFILLYILLAYTFFTLPIILPIGKFFSWTSFFLASWFTAGLLYELFNLAIPEIVLNSQEDRTLYIKFLMMFLIGVAMSTTLGRWRKLMR